MSQYLAERGEATADFRPGIGGGAGRTTKSLSGSVLFGSMGTKGPSVYIYRPYFSIEKTSHELE